MISVCMATYNGEKYIYQQINSILLQLCRDDELIIVDDSSSDATLQIVESFKDKRIKIIKNATNFGVLKSFSRAIESSSGDYIFLSDQDDIWLPGKVEKMVSAMNKSGKMLCLSDAYIMNDTGEIEGFFLETRGKRRNLLGALYKNFFIGCCMAFRKEIKPKILPFPDGINMHDQWIGLNSMMLNSFVFISEPLIMYRRHSQNVTSMIKGSIASIAMKRISVFRQIVTIFYRRLRKI